MFEIADMAESPLYPLLGNDAYSYAFSKLELSSTRYKQWETLTKSTDF